jgi:phenylpyruvate tautomerase PptA (4-oxalocrotonate tautomerase family)
MPTYIVTAAEGRLSNEEKAGIARAITRSHAEVTGAPASFAQVIVQEVRPGNHFVGGALLDADHLFVHGQIRAGRSAESKRELIERILAAVAQAAAMPTSCIWVYILDLPFTQMAEFGHILPEPGKEAAWIAALPEAERRRLQAIGNLS